METLGELARGLEGDWTALRTGDGRAYDARRFAANAMKAGNFLRLHGGTSGALVGIADVRAPEPLFALCGGALLGARVRFDPPASAAPDVLVAPTARLAVDETPPGASLVGFGDPPAEPSVAHFERGLWSENSTFPPSTVPVDATVLVEGTQSYAHRELLDAAASVAADHVDPGDAVALRASLSDAAVVAGVLAPLIAEATIVLDPESAADVAVTAGDPPEPRTIDPETVPLDGKA